MIIKGASVIIGLLLLISSVSAVVYPQEYYDLKNQSDKVFSVINISNNSVFHNTDAATYVTVLEIRKQNILLEKQNSLLEEQVKAQWVGDCYRVVGWYSSFGGNNTGLKNECVNAGYPFDR